MDLTPESGTGILHYDMIYRGPVPVINLIRFPLQRDTGIEPDEIA